MKKTKIIPISVESQDDSLPNENINNYLVASVSDPTNFKEVYHTELNPNSHTKLYQDTTIAKERLKDKWQQVFGIESKNKRSRFYKNYEKIMTQTSSGIEQVLERIDSAGQTSDSVYASAVTEEELKQKFPDAIFTEDPYTQEQKLAMHEAINGDGAVKRGLSFWRKFLLGREVTAEFLPRKELDDEEQQDAVNDRMSKHPDVNKYKNKIREIDDEVKLRESMQANCDNLFGFGRCCFVKLENDVGYPVRLVPLSSYKLGKVWIDAKTFEFLGVEYLEIKSKEGRNILLANDILYFPLNDNNVTPNTRFYGNSLIFPILSISETTRINRERNFPEIIRKKWSATLVIKTSTKSPSKNQQIADLVNNRAGGTVVIPDLVSAENIKTDTELDGLINYSIETDKKIFRDMELPLTASGMSDNAVTRGNAQTEVHVWSESTLEDLRENITDMLREQWYFPNIKKIIEEDVVINGTETNFELESPPSILNPLQQKQKEPVVNSVNPENESELDIVKPSEVPTPEENMTLLEQLGFDVNSMKKITEQVKKVDDEQLKEMVLEKLSRIWIDIYQGILEISQEDVISLSDEIKFPWKVFLKFKNIILDNFLDRAAGVIGIFNTGIIDEDVSLELLKLEQYKKQMREARIRKEESEMERLRSEMKRMQLEQGQQLDNPNIQPPQLQNQNQNQNENTQNENSSQNEQNEQFKRERDKRPVSKKQSKTVSAEDSINSKIGARLSRGRVGA